MTNRFLSHKGNHRDSKHHRSWKVTCCMCKAVKIITCPRSGTKDPQEYVLKEFQRCGWHIAGHSSSDCCPHHAPRIQQPIAQPPSGPVLEPPPLPPEPPVEREPPGIMLTMGASFFKESVAVRYHEHGNAGRLEELVSDVRHLREEVKTLSANQSQLMKLLEQIAEASDKPQMQQMPQMPQVPQRPQQPPPTQPANSTEDLNRQMIRRLQAQLTNKRAS
jgi:hypothetical protein